MLFEQKYAADLGSGCIKLYNLSNEHLDTIRNRVAFREHVILATGDEAWDMTGKTPADVTVFAPVKSGIISDMELQEIILYRMLDSFLTRVRPAAFYFPVSPDLSVMQKRAFYRAVNGHWLRGNRVFTVEAPVADALALGLEPGSVSGAMLVNIGDETTRLSVLGESRVIISRVVPIGGSQINEAIAGEVRSRYGLLIGTPTAERLKLKMGRLSDQRKESVKIVGLDTVSGLPRSEQVSSYVINAGIMNCMNELAAQMKVFLERIPPQIGYQVSREGIYLCGGCARIPYLDQYLASSTGFTFNLSGLFETSTVRGIGKILSSPEKARWCQPVRQK